MLGGDPAPGDSVVGPATVNTPSQMNVDLGSLGVANGDELLSDDGQHLDVDAVEFIEAAPGAGLSQTREEPPHHLQTYTGHFTDTLNKNK